jgi:hypothetical protein
MGRKFGGFLVRYISSVATLTMTIEKCAKRQRNTRGALRISNTARAKTWQFALWEIPFSAKFRILLEQLSAEHPPPTSIRTPQEEPHFVALSAGATSPLLLRSLTTTLEQIALREILLLVEIQG